MKSWTDDPVGTVAPLAGCALVTLLLGFPVTPETVSPAFCSADVAAETESPDTFGTVVVGGPVETVTVTVEPNGAWAPLAGVVEITSPEGTVVLDCGLCAALRPTAWSAA